MQGVYIQFTQRQYKDLALLSRSRERTSKDLKTKQVQKEKGEVEIENCPVLSKCPQIKGVYVKGKLYFERSKIDSIKL